MIILLVLLCLLFQPVALAQSPDRSINYIGNSYSVLLDTETLTLHVKDRQSSEVLTFSLDGAVESRQGLAVIPDTPGRLVDQRILPVGDDLHINLTLGVANGSWYAKEIELHLKPEYFTYQMRVYALPNATLTPGTIYYGGPVTNEGTGFSATQAEQLWVWRPDNYLVSLISPSDLLRVNLGSNEESARYLIPPYLAAFQASENWWGAGTLGIPNAGAGLGVEVQRGDKRELRFYYPLGGVLTVPEGGTFNGPQLGFFFGQQRDDIMQNYLAALHAEELVPPAGAWYEQWSAGPIYCTWGDQELAARRQPGSSPFQFMNTTQVQQWLADLDARDIPYQTVIIDSGWSAAVGDWSVTDQLGGAAGLRKLIDELHDRGKQVWLWFSPHWVDSRARLMVEKPDYMVRDMFGGWPTLRGFYLLDFTNSDARTYMQSVLEFLLSDRPGALNADGLKIDFLYDNPPVTLRLKNPDWGVGELYSYNVQQLIYDTAKKIKPAAAIDGSASNPLFQDIQDLARLNDDYTSGPALERYPMRAWSHAAASGTPMDSDDWHAYAEYLLPLSITRSVYSVPALYSSGYRMKNGASTPLSTADSRRLHAIFQAYQEAPIQPGQHLVIDPAQQIYKRYDATTGEPKAVSLGESSALVVYTPSKLVVVSVRDQTLTIPLPLDQQITIVRAVRSDGSTQDMPYEITPAGLILHVTDAAGEFERMEALFGY